MVPQRRILGVRIDNLGMADMEPPLMRALQSPGLSHVVTLNPEYIMAARRDPALAAVLEQAALCVPDGVGLLWAARLRGAPLRGRVIGVDLLLALCALAARLELSVYLLGGAPGVAQRAAAVLTQRYPGLTVAGASSADPTDAGVVEEIGRSKASIVFVAYGMPKQDFWIARNANRLAQVRLAVGVGGALDYLSGKVARAPAPIRRLGLEWAFRLAREPWRARRMRVLPLFLLQALREGRKRP